MFGQKRQIAPVVAIQPQRIDAKPRQGAVGYRLGQATIALDRDEIDHTAQQTARDARRAPRTPRDFAGAFGIAGNAQKARTTGNDQVKLVFGDISKSFKAAGK